LLEGLLISFSLFTKRNKVQRKCSHTTYILGHCVVNMGLVSGDINGVYIDWKLS